MGERLLLGKEAWALFARNGGGTPEERGLERRFARDRSDSF